MRKLLLILLETPEESGSYQITPFWLLWLTLYFAALPCALIVPLASFVVTGMPDPPAFKDIFFLSLAGAALPYVQLAGDRNKTVRQWDRDRARLARWRKPARLYRAILHGTSLVTVVAALAHFTTGHVTVRQVVLVTLGLPLYYALVVPLLQLLYHYVGRARQGRADATSVTREVRAIGQDALPVSAHVPPAVEAAETVTVGLGR